MGRRRRMSDNGDKQPLTRRERRLLEMSQNEQEVTPEEATGDHEPVQQTTGAEPATSDGQDIEIDESLIEVPTEDAEGNPLPRREIRRLRQEAIDELRRQQQADRSSQQQTEAVQPETDEASSDPETVAETEEALEPRLEESDAEVPSHEVPTQAFSVEELAEVMQEDDTDEDVGDTEEPAEGEISFEQFLAETEVPPTKETSVLQEEDEEATEAAEAAGEGTPVATDVPVAEGDLQEEPAAEEISADSTETGAVEEEAAPETEVPEEPATDEAQAEDLVEEIPETDTDGYTFPDIQPLGVDRPVFDDPSQRSVGSDDAPTGTGFDDMIERAVADENTNVHSGTSSLILPAAPQSDDLSGPLGGTGELFVTGSIELPKSIGETGGHSRLQDSVEIPEEDGLEALGLTDMYETGEFDSAPVSATRAVSAQSIEKTGVSTPEVKTDNKKSIIWMSSGGALILVLGGLAFWAFQSGFFG